MTDMNHKWKGISSSTLKWIAIISMLIDHFAVAVYSQLENYQMGVYTLMRGIGRIAFPIYCFLLVEGFCHTHDIMKYIKRCFIFALISEIPFDLAVHGNVFDLSSQNVFFTMTLGLCTLYAISYFEKKRPSYVISAICVVIGAAIAQVLEVDYHYMGVLCIVMFYYMRKYLNRSEDIVGAVLIGLIEPRAALAFIPIHFYNGERGMKLKYFFYWVYPVHLLVLGIIRGYALRHILC